MKKSKAGRKKSKAGTKAGEKVDFWNFLAGSKKSWSFFAEFSLSALRGSLIFLLDTAVVLRQFPRTPERPTIRAGAPT
jgi:hypothetical protein